MSDAQQIDFKPGDEIWVEVIWPEIGVKRYKTLIDAHGVQRFEEKAEVRNHIDRSGGQILNINAVRYQHGELSLIELLEFDMDSGYSVDGWCDVVSSVLGMWSNPEPNKARSLTLINPIWDGPEVFTDEDNVYEEIVSDFLEQNGGAQQSEEPAAQPDFKPGDEFWLELTVDGVAKRHKTIIDPRGVQRFEKVPEIDEEWRLNPNLSNTKAIDYQEGRLSLIDFFEWNMGLGYSVGGFEDTLGSLLDMWHNPTGQERIITISNPLWNNGEPEVWRG